MDATSTIPPELQGLTPLDLLRCLADWADHYGNWLQFHVDGPQDEEEPGFKTRFFPAGPLDELSHDLGRLGPTLRMIALAIEERQAKPSPQREPATLIAFPGGRALP